MKTCTDCAWYKRWEKRLPHDLADAGCLDQRWAGYVTDPNKPPCAGQAHTSTEQRSDQP